MNHYIFHLYGIDSSHYVLDKSNILGSIYGSVGIGFTAPSITVCPFGSAQIIVSKPFKNLIYPINNLNNSVDNGAVAIGYSINIGASFAYPFGLYIGYSFQQIKGNSDFYPLNKSNSIHTLSIGLGGWVLK